MTTQQFALLALVTALLGCRQVEPGRNMADYNRAMKKAVNEYNQTAPDKAKYVESEVCQHERSGDLLSCGDSTSVGLVEQSYCIKFDSIKPQSKTYEVALHNECRVSLLETYTVRVAFYNADNERVALDQFFIDPLSGGERVRHAFPMPDASGIKTVLVNSVKVWP